MKKCWFVIITLLAGLAFSSVHASTEAHLADIDIKQTPERLKEGANVILGICISCHSLKYIKYRDLLNVGFTQGEVDVIRGENSAFDSLKSFTPPDMAKSIFGLVPPDLSLIAKAREGGGRHVYTLLTSFYKKKDGSVDNRFIPNVRMPDVLGFSEVNNEKERKVLENKAYDAAVFLEWAADPRAGQRTRLGYFVLVYLVIFTILLYLLKKRVWGQLDK
jgi:ubiquinol-cytochrome c reductase cytochrome c1 subunit